MQVTCPICKQAFLWPRTSMQMSCPRCGKKLRPEEVLLHDERESPY